MLSRTWLKVSCDCFDPQRPWRTAASQALGIPSCHIAEDTHIKQSQGNKFTVTLRRIPAERRTIAEKSGADVVMDAGEASGSGDESGRSGLSDNSSTDWAMARPSYGNGSLASQSIGSADDPTGRLSQASWQAPWGLLLSDPSHQPRPGSHNGKIIQTATHLTVILAEYLADTVAWLMRSILDHASKILFDTDTEPLLTPGFWFLPLYMELLNSASRTDQVLQQRELEVAPVWSSLSVRKTRSREERESFMKVRHTPMIGEASPSGLGLAAW